MPRPTENQTPRRRSGGSGGGGWLFLVIVIAGIGATYMFAGDKIRAALGIHGRPSGEGAEPTGSEKPTASVNPLAPPD
jgi:hypothetical protein